MHVNQTNNVSVEIQPLKLNQMSLNDYELNFQFENGTVSEAVRLTMPYQSRTSSIVEMRLWLLNMAVGIINADVTESGSVYVYRGDDLTMNQTMVKMRQAVETWIESEASTLGADLEY